MDNWTAFRSAMEARFQRTDEAFRDYTKMQARKYKGDIEYYISSIMSLNVQAGLSGVALKAVIRHGLPKEIQDNMARDTRPDMPDLDYIELARRCGQQHEYRAEQEKADRSFGKGSADAKKPSTAEAKSTDGTKSRKGKDKAKPSPSDKKGKSQTSTPGPSKQPVTHTDKEAALKGISHTLRKERKDKKQCQRCGKWRHDWQTCRGDIATVKIAGVSQPPKKKRKASDEAEKEPASGSKKAKVTTAATSSYVQPSAFQRISEVFVEEGDELDYEV